MIEVDSDAVRGLMEPDTLIQPASVAPLYLLVMLHQAFEYYSQRLGKQLRDEWQKVQGRFESIAFIEPAEQSLRIVGAAFERTAPLPPNLCAQLDRITDALERHGALPVGLDTTQARALFERCYPLHPITLLILPTLCQKVAQNERTLFSYLGSAEPFGLRERLGRLRMGDVRRDHTRAAATAPSRLHHPFPQLQPRVARLARQRFRSRRRPARGHRRAGAAFAGRHPERDCPAAAGCRAARHHRKRHGARLYAALYRRWNAVQSPSDDVGATLDALGKRPTGVVVRDGGELVNVRI